MWTSKQKYFLEGQIPRQKYPWVIFFTPAWDGVCTTRGWRAISNQNAIRKGRCDGLTVLYGKLYLDLNPTIDLDLISTIDFERQIPLTLADRNQKQLPCPNYKRWSIDLGRQETLYVLILTHEASHWGGLPLCAIGTGISLYFFPQNSHSWGFSLRWTAFMCHWHWHFTVFFCKIPTQEASLSGEMQ